MNLFYIEISIIMNYIKLEIILLLINNNFVVRMKHNFKANR